MRLENVAREWQGVAVFLDEAVRKTLFGGRHLTFVIRMRLVQATTSFGTTDLECCNATTFSGIRNGSSVIPLPVVRSSVWLTNAESHRDREPDAAVLIQERLGCAGDVEIRILSHFDLQLVAKVFLVHQHFATREMPVFDFALGGSKPRRHSLQLP